MPKETEYKYLVDRDKWEAWKIENKPHSATHDIDQGYLSMDPDLSIRVRLESFVGLSGKSTRLIRTGSLTVKGKLEGATREEVGLDAHAVHAEQLLKMCGIFRLKKSRHFYEYPQGGPVWEIDEFESGLILAEMEMTLFNQKRIGDGLALPPFITKEVTDDPAYYNVNLVRSCPESSAEASRSTQ
jgi:CYTH domain-containing protein